MPPGHPYERGSPNASLRELVAHHKKRHMMDSPGINKTLVHPVTYFERILGFSGANFPYRYHAPIGAVSQYRNVGRVFELLWISPGSGATIA